MTKRLSTEFLPAKNGHASNKLLIVLHGLGDSAAGYRFLPEALGFDDLSYLLVNAPDSYFTGYSWFDIYGDLSPGVIRSRELLFRLLGDMERGGWDPSQTAMLGFSQGCLMTMDIACRYPKRLAGFVAISGFVAFLDEYPEAFSPAARGQRILATHGTHDQMISFAKAKEEFLALKGMGLDLEWKEYAKEHTIDVERELPDIRNFLRKALELAKT